jgi:hypothetical protein
MSRGRRTKKGCKLFWGLAFICYLEVVLWSTCLLCCAFAGGVPGQREDSAYLQRETGNLKLGFGGGCRVSLPDFDFRGFEQYQHSQEKAWQRILEASYVASTPVAVKLGAPGLAHLPSLKGVPGPYAGILAID